ncbi:hypothetical protein E4U41_003732 [Claviceps citrina]|nr:hypothetical protein E4U41_003732 [Claviceps citrina]
MKYSAALAVLVAAGAYADLQTVQTALSDISSGIDGLTSAAQGFNGDVDAVKSKADSLIASIKKGKSSVDGTSDLTLTDSLGLTEPVQALTKKGQTLADTFKSKRSDVEKAGACGTVRSDLSAINEGSQALIKSIVSKVPTEAQTIASSLAAGLTKVLGQAQEDFSESNCKDSSAVPTTAAAPTTAASPKTSAAASASQTETESAPETETAPASTTMAASATILPTHGGNTTATGAPPAITAGASFVAPAGVLVMAVVAALL